MKNFGDFYYDLNESFQNLKDEDSKAKYADKVWEILQSSYEKIGGLKGNGFQSKEDMIKKIPFWKVYTRNGEPIIVMMYKDKGGRKRVATGIKSGTKAERGQYFKVYIDMLKQEFNRSYFEVSGPVLKFIEKNFPKEFIDKYSIPVDKAEEVLKEPLNKVSEFEYSREIGGHQETKRMFGTVKMMGTLGKGL